MNKTNAWLAPFAVLLLSALAFSASAYQVGDDPEIDTIVEIFTNLTQQTYASGFPWLRQAHAKQHGCVRAIVTPLANLDPTLAQGVFAQPEPIAAFIRFSNGVARGFNPPGPLQANESDAIPDIRGFGIKLVNVSGPFINPQASSQVFTLTTDTVTFLPDISSALAFFTAVQKGLFAFSLWAVQNPTQAAGFAGQATIISDLLTTNFYSPVPNVHGAGTGVYVKHHVYPTNVQKRHAWVDPKPDSSILDFNYLRDRLITDLDGGNGYTFTWAVQVYENEYTTPLNDSTTEWPVPYQDIATIYIPPQNSWDDAQEDFCTFMSFNPGLSTPDHVPYGPIQEIRSAVYNAMANLRHSLDNQPQRDADYQDWLNWPSM
eukprot:TRINITY_DN6049_c0_g1_i1.p1 TRINITY_DN6049_c0_g1~~TRINITY_DN6049_c0_g1_i1.p1  ORF type:complete len:374 (-),score=74.68 TRINITY_DN6049_c0_g1_i1:118-1239(-)